MRTVIENNKGIKTKTKKRRKRRNTEDISDTKRGKIK